MFKRMGHHGEIAPWWARIPQILAYPASQRGLIAVAFLILADILRGFAGFAGLLGIIAYLALTGAIVAVLFTVIRNSADGYTDFPEVDLIDDVVNDLLIPGLKYTALSAILFGLPAVMGLGAIVEAVTTGKIESQAFTLVLALLLFAVAVFIQPLATVILAMSHSLINAVNPVVWWQILSRVLVSYLGVFFATLILQQSMIFLPGFLNLIAAPFKMYLAVCGAHLLGWFIFQNHQRLGHRPRSLEPPPRATVTKADIAKMPQIAGGGEAVDPAPQGPEPSLGPLPTQRNLPDMSVPESERPQFGGSFAGASPAASTPGPTWNAAAPPSAAGGFLEVDEPSAADPWAGQMGNPSQPAVPANPTFEPSGLELAEPSVVPEADPGPETVTSPTPAPDLAWDAPQAAALEPAVAPAEPASAVPAEPPRISDPPEPEPVAAPIDPEIQPLQEKFDAAVAGRSAEALAIGGALIRKFWEKRLMQRAHDTYRVLAGMSPNACLSPPEAQLKIARELDAMGDAQLALSAWRAFVAVQGAHAQAPRALLRCAELYIQIGRSDYAKSCLEAIVTRYPQCDVFTAAQQRLRKLA